ARPGLLRVLPLTVFNSSRTQFRSFPVVPFDRPDPDVPVPRGIAVVLEADGALAVVGALLGDAPVRRGAEDLLLLVGQHAVVEDRDGRGLLHLAVLVVGGVEDDVVGLPLAGLAGGIDQRRPLAVERGGLAVGIRGILVAVEDLDLVAAVQEDAAVAA